MLGSNLLGIGQKSGVYRALNPDTGTVVWQTQVGPGSGFGGIEWGTAFDGTSIYSSDLKLGISRLLASAQGRAGQRRLLGGVEPEQRPGYLADRDAGRMLAGSLRLCARLLGAWAGKRRQRGRVRRFDGREPAEPDDVRT